MYSASFLPLSISVFLVKIYTESLQQTGEDTERFGHLMRVLHSLQTRFSGAQFVTLCVDALMKSLPRKLDLALRSQRQKSSISSPEASGRHVTPALHTSDDTAHADMSPGPGYCPGSDLSHLLLDQDEAVAMKAQMSAIYWAGQFIQKCFVLRSIPLASD